MPAWIHDRVDHIRAKNPSMPESEAWAIATQQSHALGKTPKSYGTVRGRETAKAKYKTPEDDVKKANPGKLKVAGFVVNFGLDGRPSSAQTHDEWLVSLLRRDGSFMAPDSLAHVPAMKKHALLGFVDELEKIANEKDSGFMGDLASKVKTVATTPIAGTGSLNPFHGAAELAKGMKPAGQASKGFQAFQAGRAAMGH